MKKRRTETGGVLGGVMYIFYWKLFGADMLSNGDLVHSLMLKNPAPLYGVVGFLKFYC